MQLQQHIGAGALALILTASLYGCGNQKEAGDVAATVNGNAISVALVEHEVKKLGEMSAERHKEAAGQILKNLVDQDLLVQKALADKLDQDPEVALALEAARRQILAQNYVEKSTAGVAAPSDTEVAEYFAAHPELFSQRRIYRLQEISIPVTAENQAAVQAQLAGAHSLDDFAQWLKDQGIQARVSQSTKAAEHLPAELLPRLAQMKDGQAMTMRGPDSLNVLVVAGSQSQPVTLEQAKASIERFVANQKKREAATTALKTMRDAAKVEYLGEFAGLGQAAAETAPAETAPAAAAPTDAK